MVMYLLKDGLITKAPTYGANIAWSPGSPGTEQRRLRGQGTYKPADLGIHHDQRARAQRRDGGI